MSKLLYDYFFYYSLKEFKKESRLLLLILKRHSVCQDVCLYICKHLASLHRILPHPSLCPQVESVFFDSIDRGIYDYKEFAQFLKKFFPGIKRLTLSQKFSSPNTESTSYFIKTLGLERLQIIDSSGEDWSDIDWKQVLHDMPNSSEYTFILLFEHIEDDKLLFEDSNSSKQIKIWKCDDANCEAIYGSYDRLCNRIRTNTINNNSNYMVI